MLESLRTSNIPEKINATNIVLIPKTKFPESLKSFGPISLCNTVYKIITKLIVKQIRPYLFELINPFQASFFLGRKLSDNVITTQELIYSFHKMRKQKHPI